MSTLGPEAVRIIAETFAELVTGQMRETIGVKKEQDPVEHYLKVVWEKTGSLIAASGRFGGTFSGADAAHIERLERLGDAVGTAFQISDDIIDISSVSAQSRQRRPAPTCARESTPCPSCTPSAKKGPTQIACGSFSRAPVTEDALVEEALELLERSPGMVKAKAKLGEYAVAAKSSVG